MLKIKKFVLPLFAMVATVALGNAQTALADHDHWNNGHNDFHHSNQVVYRSHHSKPYYKNRYNIITTIITDLLEEKFGMF